MPRQAYATVNIPLNLIKQMDELVGQHGYTSRAEVVRAAMRMLLRYYAQPTAPGAQPIAPGKPFPVTIEEAIRRDDEEGMTYRQIREKYRKSFPDIFSSLRKINDKELEKRVKWLEVWVQGHIDYHNKFIPDKAEEEGE